MAICLQHDLPLTEKLSWAWMSSVDNCGISSTTFHIHWTWLCKAARRLQHSMKYSGILTINGTFRERKPMKGGDAPHRQL